VDLVKAVVGAGQPSDVEDAAPQRVCLGGDTEAGTEGELQNLARGGREDGARGAGEEAASGDVRLARPEPDRYVDGDDLRVRQLLEARLDGSDEVIYGEATIVEDDRNPTAFRAVDAGDRLNDLRVRDSA
jgi:hypothetical protein